MCDLPWATNPQKEEEAPVWRSYVCGIFISSHKSYFYLQIFVIMGMNN